MTNNRALAALAACMVLSAAGCAAAQDSGEPVAAASAASQSASVPASASAPASAPPGADDPRLATLSIAQWTGFPDAGELDVTFHLNEHCTYVSGPPKEPVLVVWPAGQAWIDPAKPDTVRLREPAGGKITEVTDGQRVNLGGAPATNIRPFVTAPHESCPDGKAFLALQIF